MRQSDAMKPFPIRVSAQDWEVVTIREAATSRDCNKALGAAGESAEQHHGRVHRRSVKVKAASRVAMSTAAR